jgi:hypothetical protein
VVVRCAAHSGDSGTVFVKGILIDNTNTAAEQVALEEVIRSIRVGSTADFDSSAVIELEDEDDLMLTPLEEPTN